MASSNGSVRAVAPIYIVIGIDIMIVLLYFLRTL